MYNIGTLRKQYEFGPLDQALYWDGILYSDFVHPSLPWACRGCFLVGNFLAIHLHCQPSTIDARAIAWSIPTTSAAGGSFLWQLLVW